MAGDGMQAGTRQAIACEGALRELVAGFPEIEVAYVFGSRARGAAAAASDLDVAVLVAQPALEADPLLDLRMRDFLERRCRMPADVTLLNRADPVLQHEVLRTGRRFYEADPERRATWEVASFRRYLDHRYYQAQRARTASRG